VEIKEGYLSGGDNGGFHLVMEDRALIISRVCDLISREDIAGASSEILNNYPFQSIAKISGNFTIKQKTEVFIADGFIDRYRGTRLIYPPVLYLISTVLPNQFPSHPNWKMSESHIAFWELFPTVDHLIPRARGGLHDKSNWVTCSMLTNSAKDHWMLDELGWKLHEPGDFSQWDGLLNWFVREMEKDEVRNMAPKYCHDWLKVAKPFASVYRR
jgi:hypothetical protein